MDIYTRLGITGMAVEGENVYFVPLNKHILVRYNRRTKEKRILWKFKEKDYVKNTYYTVLKVGDKLILVPHGASCIAIYNTQNEKIITIEIEKNTDVHNQVYTVATKFWNTFIYDNKVYFFGYSYPAIMVLDLSDFSVHYLREIVKDIDTYIDKGDTRGFFGEGYMKKGEKLYIPVGCLRKILEINLINDQEFKITDVNVPFSGIGGMECVNDKIWMTGRGEKSNTIVCTDLDFRIIKTLVLEDDSKHFDLFNKPISMGNKLIILPVSSKSAFMVDSNTYEVTRLTELDYIFLKNNDRGYWGVNALAPTKMDNEVITFISGGDFGWHDYNIVTNSISDYDVKLEIEDQLLLYNDIFMDSMDKTGIIDERSLPLDFFLQKI